MISAAALAPKRTLRSIGANRIASKPPSSRSATNSRLIPSTAANRSVAHSTPEASEPERLVRSSPKRKMMKAVTAKSAIAGSDCRVRSSERRSLARIAAKATREGVTRHAPFQSKASRDRRHLADPEPQHLISLRQEALRVVGDDYPGVADAGADQLARRLPPFGVEVGIRLVEQQQLGLVQ